MSQRKAAHLVHVCLKCLVSAVQTGDNTLTDVGPAASVLLYLEINGLQKLVSRHVGVLGLGRVSIA